MEDDVRQTALTLEQEPVWGLDEDVNRSAAAIVGMDPGIEVQRVENELVKEDRVRVTAMDQRYRTIWRIDRDG